LPTALPRPAFRDHHHHRTNCFGTEPKLSITSTAKRRPAGGFRHRLVGGELRLQPGLSLLFYMRARVVQIWLLRSGESVFYSSSARDFIQIEIDRPRRKGLRIKTELFQKGLAVCFHALFSLSSVVAWLVMWIGVFKVLFCACFFGVLYTRRVYSSVGISYVRVVCSYFALQYRRIALALSGNHPERVSMITWIHSSPCLAPTSRAVLYGLGQVLQTSLPISNCCYLTGFRRRIVGGLASPIEQLQAVLSSRFPMYNSPIAWKCKVVRSYSSRRSSKVSCA